MKYKLLFIIVAGSLYTSVWGIVNFSNKSTAPTSLVPLIDVTPISPSATPTVFKPVPNVIDMNCDLTDGIISPTWIDIVDHLSKVPQLSTVSCPQKGMEKGDITVEGIDDNFRYWKLKEVCDCYASKGISGVVLSPRTEETRKNFNDNVLRTATNQRNSLMIQASYLYPDDSKKTAEVSQLYSLVKYDAPNTAVNAANMISESARAVIPRLLTKSDARECLPMREYLAFKSISQDIHFYSDLKAASTFDSKDWNFETLRKGLQASAIKSGKTSMESILGWPDSPERQSMRKLEFLAANPLYKNLFLLDGKKNPKIGEAQKKLFNSLQSSYGKCNDLKCAMGKKKDLINTEREIFTDKDISAAIQGQTILFSNLVLLDYDKSAARPYVAPSSKVNELVTKSEEEMLANTEDLVKSCQEVNGFIETSRDFSRDLANRLSNVLELDPEKNEGYKEMKKAVCEQPRTRKDGKETLTFDQYMSKRKISDKPGESQDALADYLKNYRAKGELPNLSLLESYLRKNYSGGATAQDAQDVATRGVSKEKAAILNNEVAMARREMLNRDSQEIIDANPDIFGGGSYNPSTDGKLDHSTKSRLPASISEDASAATATSSTVSADPGVSSTPISSVAATGMDNFNVSPSVAPSRQESGATRPVSESTSENDVSAQSSQTLAAPITARERELETRLATLESELDKSKKAEQTSDYKKILDELEALKAQRAQDAAKAAQDASEVAQTDRQVRSHSSAISSGNAPVASQGSNLGERAPASVAAPIPTSSYSSAVANLAPLSASSGALAGSYQKALNDRYKVPATTPGVLVKEGEFSGKVVSPEVTGTQTPSSEFALTVSQELYSALASANPVNAQATFQKELQGQFKSLSDRPLGSIVAIKSGASTTLKFMVVKLNDQVFFEPLRVSTLKGLRDNLNAR